MMCTYMNRLIMVFLSSEVLLLARYMTEQHTPIHDAHFIWTGGLNVGVLSQQYYGVYNYTFMSSPTKLQTIPMALKYSEDPPTTWASF